MRQAENSIKEVLALARPPSGLDEALRLVFVLLGEDVAESQPWSGADWAVAPRFDHARSTVLVLVSG